MQFLQRQTSAGFKDSGENTKNGFRERSPLSKLTRARRFSRPILSSFSQTPWNPLRIPLSKGCLAVVSTAGLFRKGIDAPFADTAEGDPRVIQLSSNLDPKSIDTAHTHIPPEPIRADVNVALPFDPLRDLVKEKKIGSLAPRFFSFVGYQTRADEVALEMGPNIAAAMVEDKVPLALIVPV